MKSNKKRILFVLAILTMALVLSFVFVACDKKDTADKTNSNDLGVYYEVVGSSLDKNSYIELKSGNVWYDGEDQGTFKINGGNITLYDGDTELMSGTISNGVLTLNFMGETTVYKKSGSMGSGNVDQKAMIQSIQNGKVDGLTVSLEIDNTVEDVDLSGMITTSKDCSWQLYTSRTATSADAIVTKIIVPKNGNNTYYIVVTSADGKTNRTYTLNVWKNYYVTLSFYANDTFYTSEQVLTHTTYGSGPSCSVAGYSFNGWGCDGYYVTESKSFNANLTPLTYTAKFDSNGGSTVSDKTATFNNDLSLPSPYKTGYTFLGWYLNGNLYKGSIKYTYTNDVTFTARWQITSYNVVIKSDNEELGTVYTYNGKKDYNSPISLSATTKLGCSFVGWFANGTKISTNKTYTINVPAYDVTYVAIFEKDERLANFKCSMTENSCVITGVLDKNITTVLIPDYVTGISGYAFSGCTGLTSVTIGSGVASIGNYAFEDCTGLTSVTIPDSVTSIGNRAFDGCIGLTSVTIGSGVTSIGYGAFLYCYRLIEVYNKSTLSIWAGSSSNGYVACYAKNVYTTEGGSKLTTDENGYVIYTNGGEKILVAYHGTNTELALPSYITKINQYAFYNCTGLTSVTIGGSVTSIGEWAFWGCTGLTSVTIPDSVTSIGDYAFKGCTGLTSVTIGNGVTSIGDYAFRDCTGLTSVTIPGSVTRIGNGAFSYCNNLQDIYITEIGAWFNISGLDNLMYNGASNKKLYINNELATSITIPNGVKAIPSYAFYNCTGLTSVTIGDSVTSIGDYAFDGCYRLVEVYNKSSLSITAGSSSNGYVAYYAKNVYTNEGGSKLTTDENGYVIYTDGDEKILVAYNGTNTKLILPSYITKINQYAFYNCTGLTSVTIGGSVTSIGDSAFSNCYRLIEVYNKSTLSITAGSSSNGYVAYYAKNVYKNKGESKLTTDENGYVIYTDGYEKILVAYHGTNTELALPSYITKINQYAFYNCSSLTSVTIPDSVTSIGSWAFYNTLWYNKQSDGLVYAGKVAYKYKGTMPSNTSIVLKEGTLGIAGSAFYNCKGLTSVTIPDSVTSIGERAFYNCTGLTSVTIPDSVTSIDFAAFGGCSSLESITIPFVGAKAGVTNSNTYQYPFGYIFGTSSYDGGVATEQYYYGNSTSTSETYYIPSSLKSVTVTGGNILFGAFSYCTGLTSITIPNSVTSIGGSAFNGCTGLTSVTIGGSVTSIGNFAFDSCTGLTNIKFNGTIAQWNAISKGYLWKYSVPSACKVICTDGTVSI